MNVQREELASRENAHRGVGITECICFLNFGFERQEFAHRTYWHYRMYTYFKLRKSEGERQAT